MSTEVTSPMPGKIVRMDIQPGKSVTEDYEILVIEAMKMETPVYAPCTGIVDRLDKVVGDEVLEDEVIAVIA